MDKKESFRNFASNHPELITSIKNGETTWQKLYEIYDIYGEKEEVWQKYLAPQEKDSISRLIKNIDMDSIQNDINTAQKALSFISELTSKNSATDLTTKGPTTPRPINKFFGD